MPRTSPIPRSRTSSNPDEENPPIRAATYARTSTPQQKSCTSQLDLCKRLIGDRQWHHVYQLKDEGWRGRDEERPAYQRLMTLAHEGAINAIVVWKLDRLIRSLRGASTLQEQFAEWGVALVSYTEPFDTTTSLGRYVFGTLANASQFETDIIKERAQLGHERRVLEGKWTGSHVPFAYRRDSSGKLSIDPAEHETLLLMHRNYARCRGDGQLATWLNKTGIDCRGKPWNEDRVRRALTNPIAIGDLTVRGITHHHDNLVTLTRSRFNQTNQQRTELRYLGKRQGESRRKAAVKRVFDAYLADLHCEPDDEIDERTPRLRGRSA